MMSFAELTNTELLYLDQVGDLPVTSKNEGIIAVVESHALSLTDPHRDIFLAHLKGVNPKIESRVQKLLAKLNG